MSARSTATLFLTTLAHVFADHGKPCTVDRGVAPGCYTYTVQAGTRQLVVKCTRTSCTLDGKRVAARNVPHLVQTILATAGAN